MKACLHKSSQIFVARDKTKSVVCMSSVVFFNKSISQKSNASCVCVIT